MYGKIGSNKGKKFSEEIKKKISESLKGKPKNISKEKMLKVAKISSERNKNSKWVINRELHVRKFVYKDKIDEYLKNGFILGFKF